MIEISCHFAETLTSPKKLSLSTGIHVIYGESNVGKSDFIRQLIGFAKDNKFRVQSDINPSSIQIIMQNPDNQILSYTIERELAFSYECSHSDSKVIQNYISQLKNDLLFDADRLQHPGTLSGGEKELLNLVTGFSVPAKLYCIDDGISFLNTTNKAKMVTYIQEKAERSSSTILWFTSDISDCKYGKSSWELTGTSLVEIESKTENEYPPVDIAQGSLCLNIDELRFGYTSDKVLFDQYTFSANDLRCLGIIGANGCGKTTLSLLLLNILQPHRGEIKITCNDSEPLIGYLDQFPERMLGANTIKKFIEELSKENILKKENLTEISSSLMEWNIELEKYLHTPAMDLPWSILRIMMIILLTKSEYDILILDEPTFGLGWKQKVNLNSYLHHVFQKKHGIILSHDIEFVESMCDKILSLDKTI